MNGVLGWEDIETITGGKLGAFDAPCPACAPDRPNGFRQARKVLRCWRIEDDFASFNCTRCGARGWVKPEAEPTFKPRGGAILQAMDALECHARVSQRETREAEEAAEKRRRSAWAEFTFLSADAIEGTPAEAYLASRGLTPGQNLRFSPWAPVSYGDKPRSMPGMIAAVRDTAGEIIGCHCTYLDAEGRKTGRKMFGRVGGGAIRLAPVTDDGVLAVAEGVETARAFTALHDVPCWSALSAPGIEAFGLPSGLTKLYIAGDADAHGRGLEAAQALAKRASSACAVIIAMPKCGDWADVLEAKAGRVAA